MFFALATVVVATSPARAATGAPEVVAIELTPSGAGYWVLDHHGRVAALGDAAYLGGSPPLDPGERAIAITANSTGAGYRIYTSTGRVVAFGDATHHGDRHGLPLNEPIVDAVSTASGAGYLLLGADGGVFSYGDAPFHGSIQGLVNDLFDDGRLASEWLSAPIVGVALTDDGYWLAAADGGMFSFGDAVFHGSVPGVLPPGSGLDQPIAGVIGQAEGYLLVGADGGVFNFGQSQFHGSLPGLGTAPSAVVTDAAVTPDRDGYSLVSERGAIWPFGSLADELGTLLDAGITDPVDPGDVVGCADFEELVDAQIWFDRHRPFFGDVAGLDTDGDGLACRNDLVEVDPGLTIAVIGDTGIAANATAVLELIAAQGADLTIHVGDFDYVDDPDAFEAWIDTTLGPDHPYFAAVGNHDLIAWPAYRADLVERLDRIDGAVCAGEYGVNSTCTYRGVSFVLSGVGTLGTGHEVVLDDWLTTNQHRWRLCAWHKNQRTTQVGGKTDEVGWEAFELCRSHGALIVNGHEHSYSRTKTLVDVSSLSIDPEFPDGDAVRVGPGQTFVAVSGLGGRTIRPQLRCLPATPPYGCGGEWASISSSSNGASEGALFLELGVDGDPRKGRGTFIDVHGAVIDSFTIWSQNEAG